MNLFLTNKKIARELEPLIKFINFSQIKGKILADIIESLEIIPAKIIVNVYRQKSRLNNADGTRGIYRFNEFECFG